MNTLRGLIKENLLLEKRIGQISANFEIVFGFDVITTKHSKDRSGGREELEGYNQRPVENKEIVEVLNMFKKDIAEKIIMGEIKDQENFVVISNQWELAMAIIPEKEANTYWKLIVKTVFRQSDTHKFLYGRNQVVLEK
jgi:hypothetical protein